MGDVKKVLDDTYETKKSIIEKSFANRTKEIELARIFCVIREGKSFKIFPYQLGLGEISQPNATYYLNTPPEVLPSDKKRIVPEFEKHIGEFIEKGNVFGMIRFVGKIFRDVHQHSRTVSDRIEFGMNVIDKDGKMRELSLLEENEWIIKATDNQLRNFLRY